MARPKGNESSTPASKPLRKKGKLWARSRKTYATAFACWARTRLTAAAVLCLALGIGHHRHLQRQRSALRQLPRQRPPGPRLHRISNFPMADYATWPPPWNTEIKRDATGFVAVRGGSPRARTRRAPVNQSVDVGYVAAAPHARRHSLQGRLLNAQDDAPNAPLTAVIPMALAARLAAPVLGRDIRLNGNAAPWSASCPWFSLSPRTDPPELCPRPDRSCPTGWPRQPLPQLASPPCRESGSLRRKRR